MKLQLVLVLSLTTGFVLADWRNPIPTVNIWGDESAEIDTKLNANYGRERISPEETLRLIKRQREILSQYSDNVSLKRLLEMDKLIGASELNDEVCMNPQLLKDLNGDVQYSYGNIKVYLDDCRKKQFDRCAAKLIGKVKEITAKDINSLDRELARLLVLYLNEAKVKKVDQTEGVYSDDSFARGIVYFIASREHVSVDSLDWDQFWSLWDKYVQIITQMSLRIVKALDNEYKVYKQISVERNWNDQREIVAWMSIYQLCFMLKEHRLKDVEDSLASEQRYQSYQAPRGSTMNVANMGAAIFG